MKNIIILISFVAFSLSLGAQNKSIQDEIFSYDDIIPNLTTLKEIRPKESFVDLEDYRKVIKSEDASSWTFIGVELDTKFILEKLNHRNNSSITSDIIKNIEIYCNRFVMNDDLIFPQSNILINAQVIEMNKHTINTSPKEYLNSKSQVQNTTENGRDGKNAGDIIIKAPNIIDQGNFIANGSKGENRVVPEYVTTWPETPNHIEYYGECGKHLTGGKSKGLKNLKSKNIAVVYAHGTYEVGAPCKKYYSYDKFSVIKEKGRKSKLKDLYVGNRIKLKSGSILYKTGAGGNAGVISINTSSNINLDSIENKKGIGGKYYSRKDNETVKYINDGQYCDKLEFLSRNYFGYEIKSKHTRTLGFSSLDVTTKWNDPFDKIQVPSSSNMNLLVKDFTNAAGEDGEDGIRNILNENLILSNLSVMDLVFEYYEENYASIDGLSTNDRERFYNSYTGTLIAIEKELAYINSIKKNFKAEDSKLQELNWQEMKLNNYRVKAYRLDMQRSSNTDQYGNVPGYRPLLSFVNSSNYIDKNLESDLELYVTSKMESDKQSAKSKYLTKVLPKLMQSVEEQILKDTTAIGIANSRYDDLDLEIEALKVLTDSIQYKLKLKSKEIKDEIKRDLDDKYLKVGALKVLALAASVIPYGQPVLGEVGGKTLLSMAKGIEAGESSEAIMTDVFTSVDLKSVMDGVANRKISTFSKDVKKKFEEDNNTSWNLEQYGPPSHDDLKSKYEGKIKKYGKKIQSNVNRTQKLTQGIQGLAGDFANHSVSSDEIDKLFASYAAKSLTFRSIMFDLKKHQNEREKLFSKLNLLFNEIIIKRQDLSENIILLEDLRRQSLNGAGYDESSEVLMKRISEFAKERLDYAFYNFVKVYEYTTLTPYSDDDAVTKALSKIDNKDFSNINEENLASLRKTLSMEYDKALKTIKSSIIDDLKANKSQDVGVIGKNEYFGRELLLSETMNGNNHGGKHLNELNEKQETSIDLYKSLNNEIIRPDEEQIRIMKISLANAEFVKDLPKGSTVTIRVQIGESGVLRKGKSFFLIDNNNGDGSSESWTFTLDNTGKLTIPSELSSEYVGIINSITNNTVKSNSELDKSSTFTFPPAWTTLNVSYTKSGDYFPDFKELKFLVACSYTASDRSRNKVLEVIQENETGANGILVKSKSKTDTIFNDYYQVYTINENISLSIDEDYLGDDFSHWKIMRRNAPYIYTDKKIELKLDGNTRVKAIFNKSVDDTSKPIFIYDDPNEKSTLLDIVFSKEELQLNDVLPDKNGWYKVNYNMNDAYFKE